MNISNEKLNGLLLRVEEQGDDFNVETETKANETIVMRSGVKDELNAIAVTTEILKGLLVGDFAE